MPPADTRNLGPRWLDRNETGRDAGSQALRVSLQMVDAVLNSSDAEDFFRLVIPDLLQVWSGLWGAVYRRTPDWSCRAQYGRCSIETLPFDLLAEVLDRDRSAVTTDGNSGWSLLIVPISGPHDTPALLVIGGPDLDTSFPGSIGLGQMFAACHAASDRSALARGRDRRLTAMLELVSSFGSIHDTETLLETLANAATDLLGCDRASIFIWDRDRDELVACPALGVKERTLRLPDNRGIVGEVIHSGTIVQVDDAYSDARFDSSVDRKSGYRTRNLLCTPLRDQSGKLIGAFQAINKLDGTFTHTDVESLTVLGTQAATALHNAREREQMIRSRDQLTEQISEGVRIVGESPAIVALRDTIGRLANTDLPVLVLGESGTGKEVVAQSLHYQGPRREHPFIAVNCAALSETLLESELFGHEKGAFTDAHEARKGKFELAENGTLFLDEIGDMSPGGQAKLLRVLEQKVISRVGGSQTIPINVRVIAATNAQLQEAIRERRFREDLFYRLSIVTLELPPLRDRPEDILPLAEHFLERFSREAGRRLQFSAEARRRLQAHSWPGNIRELRNLIERVAFLAPGAKIEADDLAFILSAEPASTFDLNADLGLTEATKSFQQDFLRRAIKRVNNNMSEAAKLLGLHRSNLYRKMRQLDMREAGDHSEE